ncbi:hypothetical protein ES319_D01G220900v1 [Gossypium barbadense]|uniref:BZIP domain-containing protein n=2 Tax=Gossypium TaxID=3633 RepID=A0A5J5SVE3_GOSBA|nr:hypothetical protein ES319_D01G220900v1 [Gossypium barbadense]TYG84266.1 hypothetical protein ES288_D01G236100v1 [Gossypium darwinii]
MEEIFQTISWEEPHPSQKLPCESCSDADEDNWRSASPSLQPWDGSFLYPDWAQSHNQPGISSGVVPNQISNHSPSLKELTNNHSILKRNLSSVSGSERALRKKRIDQAYRERCKNHKMEMQSNVENLKDENDSLKKENTSLLKDYSLMNQTLRDQEKEIEQLRNDLLQLKREHEKQNVLVLTLSGLLADPMRLENEKLKDENASLRKNANPNCNLPQLAEENAKLRIENKVLKVQNDALCGKIISDDDKKHEQEHLDRCFSFHHYPQWLQSSFVEGRDVTG